ncbi:MAG: thiamine-phosphate kinase [Dehalococcoidales bacterium]|nr:thiamine-phosphate kinase [Dehalococcoidales bacterium]
MKVSRLGEFGLIDLLNKMIKDAKLNTASSDLILGIGDDTAAWKGRGQVQLATVDTMVQGIHFTLETTTWEELGWKSLAINISDIASMGGIPRYALVALALPYDAETGNITGLYKGMIEIARKYKVAIAGGNISRAPQVSITVTVLGSSPDSKILKRSAAKVGDTVAITGYAGSAAAGMEILEKGLKFHTKTTRHLKNAFLHPVPRVEEGRLLVRHGITTAIDTSDGLLADLRHICEASGVGAKVITDLIPINNMVKTGFKEKALELALGGGEDYELLFTGDARKIAGLKEDIKCPVTVIGDIIKSEPGKIELVDADGKPVKTRRTGWKHF